MAEALLRMRANNNYNNYHGSIALLVSDASVSLSCSSRQHEVGALWLCGFEGWVSVLLLGCAGAACQCFSVGVQCLCSLQRWRSGTVIMPGGGSSWFSGEHRVSFGNVNFAAAVAAAGRRSTAARCAFVEAHSQARAPQFGLRR